jgi:hypothetical protein
MCLQNSSARLRNSAAPDHSRAASAGHAPAAGRRDPLAAFRAAATSIVLIVQARSCLAEALEQHHSRAA